MARGGGRTAVLAGLLLAVLGVTIALEWRPLARAWHLRDLERDPGKLAGYARAPRGSVRGEALVEYLRTQEGGAAYLDYMVGKQPPGSFLFDQFDQSCLGPTPWPLEALAGRIVDLRAPPPGRQAVVKEDGCVVIRQTPLPLSLAEPVP